MNVDELIRRDSLSVDDEEWTCVVERHTRTGINATLIGGEWLKSGSVHLLFEFTALLDTKITGTYIYRSWWEKTNTFRTKVVRTDAFPVGIEMHPGDRIEIEGIINPEDWA